VGVQSTAPINQERASMYNVKSKKHGFTVREEDGTPVQYTYRQAQSAIVHYCEKHGMDPKEFEIVPSKVNQGDTPPAANDTPEEPNNGQ
jgi:hypothetical protein